MVKNPNVFQIGIKIITKERLDKLRHSGQSWDGIITELLDNFDKLKHHNPIDSFSGKYSPNAVMDIDPSINPVELHGQHPNEFP